MHESLICPHCEEEVSIGWRYRCIKCDYVAVYHYNEDYEECSECGNDMVNEGMVLI
jgi:rRNA maturation endonuclease Nob1